jgi:transcriptional regulator with XRE-family HTH domain
MGSAGRRAGRDKRPDRVVSLDQVIGSRLRELRHAAGYSQAGLAEALSQVPALSQGWGHVQTVNQAERGQRTFTAEDLWGLSAFFGVPLTTFYESAALTLNDVVHIGRVDLPVRAYLEAFGWLSDEDPAGPGRMQAGEAIAGKPELRPWAEAIVGGADFGEAYRQGRDAVRRAGRRRPVGPTVVIVKAVEEAPPIPPWGTSSQLGPFEPGDIYTAIDEWESQRLKAWIEQGIARPIRPRKEGKS